MNNATKISAFEYLLSKLLEWHREVTGIPENDISILKALKLLFFISAVDVTEDTQDSLLDDIFTNFVAMPYGHVESDVYANIKNKKHVNISINNRNSKVLESFDVNDVDIELRGKIDHYIQKLKEINRGIIEYSSFELVDLSHSWYSWKHYFSKAKSSYSNSIPIPLPVIKNEDKFFSLA